MSSANCHVNMTQLNVHETSLPHLKEILRSHLSMELETGKRLVSRGRAAGLSAPSIQGFFDDSMDRANRIQTLLSEVERALTTSASTRATTPQNRD